MKNEEATDSIAYRLNYLMHEKRLTTKEFSSLCHIPMSSLFGYTSGKTEPKASTIMRIAEALRVDPRWILGGGTLQDYRETGGRNSTTAPMERELLSSFNRLDQNLQLSVLHVVKALEPKS